MNAQNGIETNEGCIIEQAIRELGELASYFESLKYTPAQLLVHGPDEPTTAAALAARADATNLQHWETDGGCFVHGLEFTDEAWRKYLRAGEIVYAGRRYPGTLAGYMVDHGFTVVFEGKLEAVDYFLPFSDYPFGAIRSKGSSFPGKAMTLVCIDTYRSLADFLRRVLSSEFRLNGNRRRCYRYKGSDFKRLMTAFETERTANQWQAAMDGTDSARHAIADKMLTEVQAQRLALASGLLVNSTADLKRLMVSVGGFPADYIADGKWYPSDVLPILEAAAAKSIEVLNDEWAKSILPETPSDSMASATTEKVIASVAMTPEQIIAKAKEIADSPAYRDPEEKWTYKRFYEAIGCAKNAETAKTYWRRYKPYSKLAKVINASDFGDGKVDLSQMVLNGGQPVKRNRPVNGQS